MGIEPTLEAWEASVLPLNYTRKRRYSTKIILLFQMIKEIDFILWLNY